MNHHARIAGVLPWPTPSARGTDRGTGRSTPGASDRREAPEALRAA